MAILPGSLLVSVSLDGTVRSWSLKDSDLEKERMVAENSNGEDASVEPGRKHLMTEDEERELEELMDGSD